MKKRIIMSTVAACVMCFFQQSVVADANSFSGSGDLAKYLLEKMSESRKKIQNFQCVSEFDQYIPNKSRQIEVDDAKKRGVDKIHIRNMQALLKKNRGIEHKYQIDKLAFDHTGRARVENIRGIYDKSEKKLPPREIFISTWDGKNAIEYTNFVENDIRGAVLSNKRPHSVSERARHPLRSYGGHFCKALAKTIEKGVPIDIVKNENGTYRIAFMNKNLLRVGTINPAMGFSLIKQEAYKNEHLAFIYKADFREISPGIWFPVFGENEVYFTEEPYELRAKYTVKVSQTLINDPSFNENLLQVNFPDGTRVIDAVTGVELISGDPMSIKMHGMKGSQSLGEIASDTLEDMMKKDNKLRVQSYDPNIFLPNMDIALEEGMPFVLDLSNRKLLIADEKIYSEKVYNYLSKLGKGDIGWDGCFLATRGASIVNVAQESHRLLKFTADKWCDVYELPSKVELPYHLIAINKKKTSYLIILHDIKPEGIIITCKKLHKGDVKRYKPDAEKGND